MLKKKFFVMVTMVAMLFAANSYGKELLRNSSWDKLKGTVAADWRFITYGGKSTVKMTPEIFEASKVTVIASNSLAGKGYVGQRTQVNLPAGKVIVISGYYRTENISLAPKGALRVSINYNYGSKDKKFPKKYQNITLKPSDRWQKFKAVKALNVPLKDFHAFFMLYKASGKLYFSKLSISVQTSSSKINAQEKYIWRDAEHINKDSAVSNWGKKRPNYFSGSGGVVLKDEAFKWNFRIKNEVDEQTLLPIKRNYFVWLRIYGYMERPAVSVTFNKHTISSFKTQANEQLNGKGKYAGPGKYYWQPAGAFQATGGITGRYIFSKPRSWFTEYVQVHRPHNKMQPREHSTSRLTLDTRKSFASF